MSVAAELKIDLFSKVTFEHKQGAKMQNCNLKYFPWKKSAILIYVEFFFNSCISSHKIQETENKQNTLHRTCNINTMTTNNNHLSNNNKKKTILCSQNTSFSIKPFGKDDFRNEMNVSSIKAR